MTYLRGEVHVLTTQATNGAISYLFKGNSSTLSDGSVSVLYPATKTLQNCTFWGIHFRARAATMNMKPARSTSRLEPTMKLPVITATVIAYALLAAAWICYTELVIR
jgi:hypothetical protein